MAHGYNVLSIQRTNRRSPQVYVVTRFDCSLDFSWPNLILYLLAVLFVIDSRVCWSSMLLVMIATSSTHRRHVKLVSILVWVVHLALFISLLISSISVAYWVTASTPPCLMLLLIFMGLVMPCLVLMVAVRFWLRRSVRFHVAIPVNIWKFPWGRKCATTSQRHFTHCARTLQVAWKFKYRKFQLLVVCYK